MGNILIKDATIIPMYELSGRKCFTGSVGIEGRLIALVDENDGRASEQFAQKHAGDLVEIDGRGMALMPGLVNTHCHAPMTLMRSYADDLPLMPWLREYVWPFEAGMTPGDIEMGAELAVAEMLLGGTTCFVDMYFQEAEVAKAVEKTGIRAVLSSTFFAANRDGFERDITKLTARYPAPGDGRVSLMLDPHSPYSCSREDLLYIKELSHKFHIGINLHVAETLEEMEIIRESTGMSPVKYLDSLGLLASSTIAVHCVHMSEEDIDILRQRGVSVSHNPQSNMKLASGVSPVAGMTAKGVNVAIGTDGAASNNDLDMWEEMRSASMLQKVARMDACVLPAWEVLKMATVNGAHAAGLGDRIGQIREGMLADLIMVDMRKPHLNPMSNVISNLVYCAKSADVHTVIVDGRVLVSEGRLIGADLAGLYERVGRRVEEIKEWVRGRASRG